MDITRMGKVLVISPHPDDETFGCGMLIKALKDNRHDIKIIILSRGKGSMPQSNITAESLSEIRHDLAIYANKLLGINSDEICFLNFPDGKFDEVVESTKAKLRDEIKNFNPTTIMIPHKWEFSSDHMSATQIVTDLMPEESCYKLLYYCVWVYYHMSLSYIWRLNFRHSFVFSGDIHAKHKAIDIYLGAKDENGTCYSGYLPQEFLNSIKSKRELYFEISHK